LLRPAGLGYVWCRPSGPVFGHPCSFRSQPAGDDLATLNNRSAGSLILRWSFRSQSSGDDLATLNNESAGALILCSGLPAWLCLVPALRAVFGYPCSFHSQPSGDNSATLNDRSAGLVLSSGLPSWGRREKNAKVRDKRDKRDKGPPGDGVPRWKLPPWPVDPRLHQEYAGSIEANKWRRSQQPKTWNFFRFFLVFPRKAPNHP
jgi:hypothetical protein